MDIGSILFLAAIFIIVAMYISRPFLGYSTSIASDMERQMSTLMAEYDRSIDALQELDFDHALGKIPTADYPVHRQKLIERGIEILKKLDEIRGQLGFGDARGRMESAIVERRADSAIIGAVDHGMHAVDDPLEKLIIERRQASPSISGGFCPDCGQPVQKTDRFCPKCGSSL